MNVWHDWIVPGRATLWTCGLALALAGCGHLFYGSESHPRWPNYAVGFANRTKAELSGVSAIWTWRGIDYSMPCGRLNVGSTAEDFEAPDPIPPEITVIWKTADGKEHRQDMVVAKKIPNIVTWTGTVWFKFTEIGVEVVPLSKEQMHKLAQEFKQYP